MNSKLLLSRALKKEFLSAEEGQFLFENTPTADLMWVASANTQSEYLPTSLHLQQQELFCSSLIFVQFDLYQ